MFWFEGEAVHVWGGRWHGAFPRLGALSGHLGGSSGYRTWPLTLKLLRGRFGSIWGKLEAFHFCHLAQGVWVGGGCCVPSFRLDLRTHLGPWSETCFFPFLFVMVPSLSGQKLQVPRVVRA